MARKRPRCEDIDRTSVTDDDRGSGHGHKRPRLLDLPDEMLLAVASAFRCGRDLETFGAVCRRTHHISQEDRIWKDLFERRFGGAYTRGVPAMTWKTHPDDLWPPEAVAFWNQTVAIHDPTYAPSSDNALWPRCPADRTLPATFAHMRTADKGWHWLYAVHASTPRLLSETSSARPGPAIIVLDQVGCILDSTAKRIEYRGDVDSAGLPHGYGVEVHIVDDCVQMWIECAWHEGSVGGWRVRVNAKEAFCSPSSVDLVPRPAFLVNRRTGKRIWGLCRRSTMEGACLWKMHADAISSVDRCNGLLYSVGMMRDGSATSATCYYRDGSTNGRRYDVRTGKCHGEAVVHYPNGDSAVYTCNQGKIERVVSFRCSPTCADPVFAGRCLQDVGGWHLREVVDGGGSRGGHSKARWHDHAYWPRDMSKPEARLFERYIVGGLVGWDERMRAVVLESMRHADRSGRDE